MKKYKMTFTVSDTGKTYMVRTNDGFNAFELVGLFENCKQDILKQIAGEMTPDIIKREVVKDSIFPNKGE